MHNRVEFMLRHLAIAVIAMLLAACNGSGATVSPSVEVSEASATASPTPTATATQAPTEAPTPAPTGSFHLEKTCEGYECTVTKSSLSTLPIGTTISYSGPGMDLLAAPRATTLIGRWQRADDAGRAL